MCNPLDEFNRPNRTSWQQHNYERFMFALNVLAYTAALGLVAILAVWLLYIYY
jgi:hypothetical protein